MRKNEFHELAQSVEGTAESVDQKDFLVQLMAFLPRPIVTGKQIGRAHV